MFYVQDKQGHNLQEFVELSDAMAFASDYAVKSDVCFIVDDQGRKLYVGERGGKLFNWQRGDDARPLE